MPHQNIFRRRIKTSQEAKIARPFSARPQSPRRHFADYMGEGKDQLLWGGVNVTFSF